MSLKIIKILLVVVLLVLTGCSNSKNNAVKSSKEINKEINIIDITKNVERMDSIVFDEGIYFALPNNIAYMDIKSKEKVILCSNIECIHNSDICQAYTPTKITSFFSNMQKNKLFFTYKEGWYEGHVNLDICDVNGANRKTIIQIPENQELLNNFVCDDENIYFVVRSFLKEAVMSKVLKLNFETMEVESIFETENDIKIATSYKDIIVLYSLEYGIDLKVQSANSSGVVKTFVLDTNDKTIKEISSDEITPVGQKTAVIAQDNILLNFTKNEDETATVEKTDLLTGERLTLSKNFPFYGKVFQENVRMGIEEYVYISLMQVQSETTQYKYGFYGINLYTGEIKECNMRYRNMIIEDEKSISECDLTAYNQYAKERGKFIPAMVVGETSEHFVIYTAGTSYIDTQLYNISGNVEFIFDTIEIISKEDFYNNNESYIRVR